MAFNGSTHDFSIIQILNLIRLAVRTGKLALSGDYSVDLFFSEGKLIYGQRPDSEQDLLHILLESGKLSPIQVSYIRDETAEVEAQWLTIWLLEHGYITKSDLAQAVYRKVLTTVYAAILYADGTFSFEDGALPSLAVPLTAVELREVIDEGERLLREWDVVQTAVPSLDICLQSTDQLTPAAGRLLMSKIEWEVASACDGHHSADKIAQTLNLDSYRARRIVHNLLQLGMVEVIAEGNTTATEATATAHVPPSKFEAALQSLRSNLQQHLVPTW